MEEIDTFVVGDVHGRANLLRLMLDEFKVLAPGAYMVVFLGDLIDRGPGSRLVVDMAPETVEALPGSRVIQGNHESVMLNFLLGIDLRAQTFQRRVSEHGEDAARAPTAWIRRSPPSKRSARSLGRTTSTACDVQ